MFQFSAYRLHIALFVVFLFLNSAYVTTIPGLMGDEAHEGENVYHMLDKKKIEILGERSYIGAGIDYVRIPFVSVFGYTMLALRSVTLIASVLFFAFSSYLLIKYFGKYESLVPLIFLTFSPIYFTQQRLSWAVTLLPLFAVVMIWLLQSSWKHKYLVAGLVGGLGLANHLLFLPTLVAIVVCAIIFAIRKPQILISAWPSIVGFIAGFSVQFVIIQLYPDDQGSQRAIADTFSDRLHAFPALFPEIISGSSFIASYTGHELSHLSMAIVTTILVILAIIALSFSKHKKIAWIILVALLIHIFVLLRIIDRFSLRYVTVFVLGCWLLSGIGLEAIVGLARKRSLFLSYAIICLVCAGLVAWVTFGVAVPYLKTGGSTNIFSLGNRTDSASALVDTRGLFACVNGLEPVTSENVHIYNRLEFWSKQYPNVHFRDEDRKKEAKYVVEYRISGTAKSDIPGTICPELEHFRITKHKK